MANSPSAGANAPADAVFQNQVPALVAKEHFHAVLQQILFNGVVQVLGFFRTQVASKLVGYPRPFKNKVRTFCQNPGGFVSQENYDNDLASRAASPWRRIPAPPGPWPG